MKRFNYKSKDTDGRTVRGRVEAETIQEGAGLLRDRGLVIITLVPQRPSVFSLLNRFFSRVKLSDIAIFTRQFATMISAGIPITDALIIMRSQSRPALRVVIESILADVEGGSSLGAALAKHPKVFSSVYVALVRAGEEGGVLDQIMVRLADNLEAQREFQAKVKGALIYPAVVVVAMVIVAAIMMIFVVPKLVSLFGEFGTQLPLPTRVLIATSNFLASYWWLVLAVLAASVWGILLFARTSKGRVTLDEWKLRLPVFGPLQKEIILAEFARTLGLLVGAGVSILEGLKIVSGVVGNFVFVDSIKRSAVQVEQGFSLSYAFSQEPGVFPPMLFQMLAVGEEAGKLDETLLKVSRVFEQESEHLVKGLSTAIEPLIMILLGVGVAFLVIAVILPIYSLTGQF